MTVVDEHLTNSTQVHAGQGVRLGRSAAFHVMIGSVFLWADDRAALHRKLTEALGCVEALGEIAADKLGDEAALA